MGLKQRLKEESKKPSLDLSIVNKRVKWYKPILLMMPAIIVVVIFTIIPFIAAATDAFQATPDRHRPLERVASIDQFKFMFKDPAFHNALYNSLMYALISIPIILVISVIISAAISNVLRKSLRGIWQTIFFLPYVTSAVAIGLAFAFLFDADTGLLNKILGHDVPWLKDPNGHSALGAMLIYGVWRGIAFNVLIFTSAMLGVDKKLYKAASIDGAGPIKQFFSITLPSIKKTTFFLLTIGVIGAIKVFPLALFRNNPQEALDNNGSTLLIYIYAKLQISHNYMLAGAASVMILIISIIFSASVRGMVSLSLKGYDKWKEKNVEKKIANSAKMKIKAIK
ncbi:MAG: sugar ABC transporter permease [Mycoplasmatales bacterium]|nr:sugar ABC transporter permease [Mycoplasmatales bacterium]